MRMRIVLGILALGALCSCQHVVFKKPQPKSSSDLVFIPQNLQGKYVCSDDTIIIKEHSFLVIADSVQEYFLSDSLKLRADNNLYFINKKEGNYWNVLVCKPYGKDSIQFNGIFGISKDNTQAYQELKRLTRVRKSNDILILNPSKKQLDNLVKSDYFQKVMLIRRFNQNN